MISKKRKTGLFIVGLLIGGLAVGEICNALSRYHGKEAQCLTDSNRSGIGAVQYACKRAATTSGNGCSLWLGSASSSIIPTIYASSPTAIVPAAFWGMCTDYADTTAGITVKNDSNAVDDGKSLTRGLWNSPTGVSTTINLALLLPEATKTESDCYIQYTRDIIVGRYNGETHDYNEMSETITVRIPKEGGQCEIETDDTCQSHPEWGAFTNGTTTTAIKIKNSELLARSGGAAGAWGDKVYAKPTDRVAWHTCYYPGVQTETFKKVSKVTGDYTWKGYTDDRCEASPHHVDEKELWDAVGESNWLNNYYLSNTVGFNGRAPSGASMGGQAPNGDFGKGDKTVRESHNEANTVPGDAGNTITETSTTSSPIKAVVGDDTLKPVSIYGGTCHKNVNNVDSAKIDGANVYPICPATAVFVDASGNYFNPDYPDILGQVPEVPATPLTPKVDAYYCWKAITGKAKNCKDCFGDKNCMDNLGCNTCDGNSECTCNDDFQCLQCTNTYDKTDIKVATVTRGPASKNASVTVPYNYKLDTGVQLDTSHTVYAGETVKIQDFWVDILTRYNGATYDDYATKVPTAKYGLVAYVTRDPSGLTAGSESNGKFNNLCNEVANKISGSDKKPKQCKQLVEKDGSVLNPEGSLPGKPHESHLGEIGGEIQNAFDATAGDYLCMVSAVWPTESANDTDTESGGNNKSRFSAPSCVQIHKRPSFQVWGGDMYANETVNSKPEAKRNVYNAYFSSWNNLRKGDTSFKTTGGSATYFGSWVEGGLVFNTGVTTTIASGAAMGANSDAKKAYAGNTGQLCTNRAPLTFANYSDRLTGLGCNPTDTAGGAKIGSGIGDRELLIDYWANGRLKESYDLAECKAKMSILKSDNITACKRIESGTGTDIIYAENGGGITLNGNVANNQTYLIKSNETVTINNDIKYTGAFTGLGSVPKVIIYAKNVNITCGVDEVDAIIITATGGKVNTCSNATERDNNDKKRLRQLIIRGVVIADSVKLERTYGGAAWKGSGANGQGEAAEIFDYDSTMLMWSEFMSGSAETDTLQTVYQHELAPRY